MFNTNLAKLNTFRLIRFDIESQSEILHQIISDHEATTALLSAYMERYYCTKVNPNVAKGENEINLPYAKKIVDQKVNYVNSLPSNFILENSTKTKEKFLQNWKKLSKWETKDYKASQKSGIHGFCGCKTYQIDTAIDSIRQKILRPDEYIVFYNDLDETVIDFAIVYYEIELIIEDEIEKRIYLELYERDKTTNEIYLTLYLENEEKIFYPIKLGTILDENTNDFAWFTQEEITSVDVRQKLPFDTIPITEFENNIQRLSDYNDILGLIDKITQIVSDMVADDEIFASHIMITFGTDMAESESVRLKNRQATIFLFPPAAGEKQEVKYLTKDLSKIYQYKQMEMEKLHGMILFFSNRVDMTGDKFVNVKFETIRWAIYDLDIDADIKIKLLQEGWQKVFRCVETLWGIPANDIKIKYHKNLPITLSDFADVIAKLNIPVSTQTLHEQINFINPAIEKKRLEDGPTE